MTALVIAIPELAYQTVRSAFHPQMKWGPRCTGAPLAHDVGLISVNLYLIALWSLRGPTQLGLRSRTLATPDARPTAIHTGCSFSPPQPVLTCIAGTELYTEVVRPSSLGSTTQFLLPGTSRGTTSDPNTSALPTKDGSRVSGDGG